MVVVKRNLRHRKLSERRFQLVLGVGICILGLLANFTVESLTNASRSLKVQIELTDGLNEESGNTHFAIRVSNEGNRVEKNVKIELQFRGPAMMQVNPPNDRVPANQSLPAEVRLLSRSEAGGLDTYKTTVELLPTDAFVEMLFVSNDVPIRIDVFASSDEAVARNKWTPGPSITAP
jgi:hypothetical protein